MLPYDIEYVGSFDNGRELMVEVRGRCRIDGRRVRYFQPLRFFQVRWHLYRQENPDIDAGAALLAVAAAALNQERWRWAERPVYGA